ncbi:hypothetical protein C2G38_2155079 [Gigaspora rosea]|uniref:Uncharacterized protein n=1 Tax=Gigaspora rosea TaxID=44941 RepID=A0A397W5P6_9GLOM|nr:hypothetical protein C2G38_2155079 [Gigaspora rosea]
MVIVNRIVNEKQYPQCKDQIINTSKRADLSSDDFLNSLSMIYIISYERKFYRLSPLLIRAAPDKLAAITMRSNHLCLNNQEILLFKPNLIIQNILTCCYQYGKRIKNDNNQSIYSASKICCDGNSIGMCNLGLCYKYGIGVEKDKHKALLS